MCVVSMVSEHYRGRWVPDPSKVTPMTPGLPGIFPEAFPQDKPRPVDPAEIFRRINEGKTVTREEFDTLKRDVENMKALLERAVEYDQRTGQPDCESDEKVELIKRVADAVGVDLKEIFK